MSFDFSHTDIRFEFSVVVFARINSELLNNVVVLCGTGSGTVEWRVCSDSLGLPPHVEGTRPPSRTAMMRVPDSGNTNTHTSRSRYFTWIRVRVRVMVRMRVRR